MPDQANPVSTDRSAPSLQFENALRAAGRFGTIPSVTDIDFSKIREFAPWIAIIDPNSEERTLRFSLAGAGLSKFLGQDPIGYDYLDIVDPAIKGDAYDSVFLMLSRPCGLWQITPAITADGEEIALEYTGFPVFDQVKCIGQIMFLVHHAYVGRADIPRLARMQRATEWRWLETRENFGA